MNIKKTTVVLCAAALAGCVGVRTARTPPLNPVVVKALELSSAIPGGNRVSLEVKKGVRNIRRGDYEGAGKNFEAGLRLDPENANLHFLNAITYHLRSLSGDSSMLPFAETGYALSLRNDPSNYWAAYLLGHVYFAQKRFIDAQNQFSYGLLYAPEHPDLLRALAVSSYYANNLPVGRWAAEKAAKVDPQNPASWRAALFTQAAAGDSDSAGDSLRKYQTLAPADGADKKLGSAFKKWESDKVPGRLKDWEDFHKRRLLLAQNVFGSGSQAEGGPLNLGDADSDEYDGDGGSDIPTMAPPAAPRTDMAFPGTSKAPQPPASAKAPTAAQAAKTPAAPAPMPTVAPPTPPAPLPAAPMQAAAPEKPKLDLPKMTLVDVVIMRTEESRSESKGVNLLGGIKATLGGTVGYNRVTGITTGNASARAEAVTVSPTLTLAALQYNFNIFNVGVNKAEVLARPSLLALNNKPSKFFSGSTMHVQLNSNNSDGSLVDVPVGINLNVTPSFLDEETVELTVHADRSFIETRDEKLGFTVFSQTAKTSVDATAVLAFGQTLILSGLAETEDNSSKDGVPFLQSIPGVQYFFSRKASEQTKKSVLILLSPHKARFTDQNISPAEAKKLIAEGRHKTAHIKALAEKEKILNNNADAVLKSLGHHRVYREFRAGDLRLDEWQNTDSLVGGIKRTLGFIWY